MILHIDPATNAASILSLQRDLWVDIAGQGTHGRINSAIGLGGGGVAGAKTLIATIESNFNIPINHYVEINFEAFERLVKAVDGIPIYFNTGIRDFDPSDGMAHTAIHIPGPGCYTLNPEQALAYSRSRHMQFQEVPGDNDSWVNDNGNDFGRIQRQQDFIRRVMKRAIQKGVRDPRIMNQMVNAMVDSVRMDKTLTIGDILDLGRTYRSFDPDQLKTTQLPVTGFVINGASVLKPKQPEADAVLAAFRGTSANTDSAVQSITVQVHNGTGRTDEGMNVSNALQRAGFQVTTPRDELGVTGEASIIRYLPGQEKQATLLARHLRSNVIFELESGISSDDATSPLILVTGTSLTGVLSQAKPAKSVSGPTSTTTTTLPADTSTSSAPSTTTSTTVPSSTVPGFLPGPAPRGTRCG